MKPNNLDVECEIVKMEARQQEAGGPRNAQEFYNLGFREGFMIACKYCIREIEQCDWINENKNDE